MSQNIDKSKFVLVQEEKKLFDEAFQTEAIGYYKDAWLRFKKNKASVVAFIIMIFLILMAIIGPWFVSYELDDVNAKWSQRLANMPPKSELLGWDGYKEMTGYPANFSNLPEGMVKQVKSINEVGQVTVVIDYYAYIAHHFSEEIDPDTQEFADTSYTNLTIEEYEAVKAAEQEYGVAIILEDAPETAGFYKVRIDFFAFLKYIYDIDEVSFFFGSDGSGRDLFKELWQGARVSLLISFSVATINIIIGVILGSISGYYGGTVDLVMERLSEILAGLPFLAILTLLLLRFGNAPWVVVLAFTMTGWLGISALTRSQFYRYKNREYVLAARTLGAGDRRIMYRHIFPSAVGTIITRVVLYIPGVIFTESTFSFLGIINYGDIISVGRLMSNGQLVMKDSFYQLLFPAIFISLLMLSFNLFGNGLRDAFNPSLRGVEE
jgi:oligopeptide transport system permease protein